VKGGRTKKSEEKKGIKKGERMDAWGDPRANVMRGWERTQNKERTGPAGRRTKKTP